MQLLCILCVGLCKCMCTDAGIFGFLVLELFMLKFLLDLGGKIGKLSTKRG